MRLRATLIALLGTMAMAVMFLFTEIGNWTTLGLAYGAVAAAAFVVWRTYVRGRPNPWTSLVVGFVLAMAFTRLLGPFVLTPVVIAGALLAITANPWLYARPLAIAAWLVAVVAVPQILESTGVFATTWSMIDGGVCSTSAFMTGRNVQDAFALVLVNLLLLGTVAAFTLRVQRNTGEASRQLYIQAWHLNQLLPTTQIAAR